MDGRLGTDTLVYNGTNTNDAFTVGATWQVSLNTRLVLNTAGIEILTLEGLGGDDRVNLAGTGNIDISGQEIKLGGKTINSHVETIFLDAQGGNDLHHL